MVVLWKARVSYKEEAEKLEEKQNQYQPTKQKNPK